GEAVYTNTVSEPFSEDGIQKNFQINIPTTATTGKTRMRVAINRNNLNDACNAEYQVGEMEDYDIYIKDAAVAPIANCVGSINISLDPLGNASITTEDINNGSYDAYDTPNGRDLHLSLDKYNFSCENISTPTTVTLTVVDSDGLSSTCTSTVNVTSYTGNFVAPTLEDIKEYCSYTAVTPVMNLNCTQEIIATTTDSTTFNSPGSYTIDWVFDNGTTTKTSTQNITIQTPTLPTISITNISETTAIVRWESEDTDSFVIQYRLKGTTAWNEITSTLKYVKITGLDDGLEYEVQVKTASSCDDSYTGTATFNTVDVQYCNDNVNVIKDSKYYISNVHIGNINNSSDGNASVYEYYKNVSTNIVAGETFSGELTYTRNAYNNTFVTVWIDYNNNGDFSDPEDEIFSAANPGDINSVFNIALTDILVPETATLGKTRLRVSIKHNATPINACNFDYQKGEIEDYDIYIGPIDNTAFESAMITQVLNYNETDRWIEVTNTNLTETIPANKVALALFK
ncbi:fibronectin type III domain-containing protein, partial [Polaribacter sp. Z014]|uniref:fibronectin type III domain-containing protein n=1 Tax=Polaribacter sp. Z014 TaxID=2927126 RepID=UPI002020FB76